MKKKNEETKVENIQEESPSQDTLHPNSGSAGKAEMMQSLVNTLAGMSVQDLSDLFNKVQATIGHEADDINPGLAAQNKASVEMKPSYATEEFTAIFEGQELSEEFKTKATTLFESAVSVKVDLERVKLEEKFEAELNEEVSTLVENLDAYLTYAVEEWLKENKLEATNVLKQDISDEFISGLKDLFKEHYIEIPEDKVDVIEELTKRVNSLEESLNAVTEENIEFKTIIAEAEKIAALDELSEGLTAIQADKLKNLSEEVSYKDIEEFKSKVSILKESVIPSTVKPATGIINEEATIDDINTKVDKVSYAEPQIGRYMDVISRTSKK